MRSGEVEYSMLWDPENLGSNSGLAIGFVSSLQDFFFLNSVPTGKQNVIFSFQSFHLHRVSGKTMEEYSIGNPPTFFTFIRVEGERKQFINKLSLIPVLLQKEKGNIS